MKLLAPVFSVASFALFSLPALAVTTVPSGQVPEPGALALLGIGAGAAAIVWARRRNKK